MPLRIQHRDGTTIRSRGATHVVRAKSAAEAMQLEQFRDVGWCVVEGVFSRAEVGALARVATEICDRELAELRDGSLDNDARCHTDMDASGNLLPRKLAAPASKHALFHAMSRDPRLSSLVADMLGMVGRGKGEPRPACFYADQCFMKPPRHGSPKPFHQDNFYFKFEHDTDVVTAWIALDDADVHNGCLHYIDGSHVAGVVPHLCIDPSMPHNQDAPPRVWRDKPQSAAIVRGGGVVFHSGATLHTSHRNNSERWRRAYATHWAAADAKQVAMAS